MGGSLSESTQVERSLNGWVVIKTERFKESYVKLQLTETTDGEAYLPIVKIAGRRLRDGKPRYEPLFPGYLFARFQFVTQLLQLRRLHGFHSLVSFDGTPALVDDLIIEDLRHREKRTGYITLQARKPSLHIDRKVRVVDGPFSGQTGLFVRYLDGAQRVCILLDLLRSAVRLELPLESVAAVRPTGPLPLKESPQPYSSRP